MLTTMRNIIAVEQPMGFDNPLGQFSIVCKARA